MNLVINPYLIFGYSIFSAKVISAPINSDMSAMRVKLNDVYNDSFFLAKNRFNIASTTNSTLSSVLQDYWTTDGGHEPYAHLHNLTKIAKNQRNNLMAFKKYKTKRNKRITRFEAALALALDNPYGEVPLIYASNVGMVEVVKLFLSQGQDVHTIATRWPHQGMMPIHVASVSNQSAIIVVLLKNGADINTRWMGMTALMLSEEYIQSDICITRLLLEKGIDVDAQDYDGNTALMYAARLHLYDHFMAILNKGATLWLINDREESVFIVAARARNVPLVDFLLKKGAEINETNLYGVTAMDYVLPGYDRELRDVLVSAQRLNATVPTPSTSASMIKTMIAASDQRAKMRPRTKSSRAIHFTMRPGFITRQRFNPAALNRQKDEAHKKPAEDMTQFMLAAYDDNIPLMDRLLAHNSSIDETNVLGRTALMQCAERGALVTVNALLARGANATLIDNNVHDAIYYAKQRGHTPVIRQLQCHITATSGANGSDSWINYFIVKLSEMGLSFVSLFKQYS